MSCEPTHLCEPLLWPCPQPDPADNVWTLSCKRKCPICGVKWRLDARFAEGTSAKDGVWKFVRGMSTGSSEPSRRWKRRVNKRMRQP